MSLKNLSGTFRGQLSPPGTTITLNEASLQSSGAGNIAALISLMAARLALDPVSIAINGLTVDDIPEAPGNSLSISATGATCLLLNTTLLLKKLVFTLDGNNLDFYLDLAVEEPKKWTFGTISPSMATFTELDGYFLSAEFIFSTYASFKWPEQPQLTLLRGLNFYTEQAPKDTLSPLYVVERFLTFFEAGASGDTVILFGTIDLENTIQADEEQEALPAINLISPLLNQGDSFSLFGFLKVRNPRISVKTITFDDGVPADDGEPAD